LKTRPSIEFLNASKRQLFIDFADAQGKTYAMETVPGERLMLLVYEPLLAVA